MQSPFHAPRTVRNALTRFRTVRVSARLLTVGRTSQARWGTLGLTEEEATQHLPPIHQPPLLPVSLLHFTFTFLAMMTTNVGLKNRFHEGK